MSRWIPITLDTLNEAKVAGLVNALSTAALADGQADRAPGIIQGVVDDVRRKVASCQANRVDTDTTTIPRGLRDVAVDLILARLKNALEEPMTEDERANVRRADAALNRVASCDDVVDQPDDAMPAQVESTAGSPSFAGRARRNVRNHRNGL